MRVSDGRGGCLDSTQRRHPQSRAVAIVVMIVWSFWIGLIVALVGLIALGDIARGRWYQRPRARGAGGRSLATLVSAHDFGALDVAHVRSSLESAVGTNAVAG
jgi:hypothetical protein